MKTGWGDILNLLLALSAIFIPVGLAWLVIQWQSRPHHGKDKGAST